MSSRQLALSNGIKSPTYYARIRGGWTKEDAATVPPRAYHREWCPEANADKKPEN